MRSEAGAAQVDDRAADADRRECREYIKKNGAVGSHVSNEAFALQFSLWLRRAVPLSQCRIYGERDGLLSTALKGI